MLLLLLLGLMGLRRKLLRARTLLDACLLNESTVMLPHATWSSHGLLLELLWLLLLLLLLLHLLLLGRQLWHLLLCIWGQCALEL